jgi:hypothetical protein
VSFVIGAADPQQQQQGTSSSKKGPSLVLTPLPCSSMMTTSMTPRARSLSFTNYGSSGRGLSPLNHSLRRSVGSGGMVTLTTTNTVSVPRSASQHTDADDLNDTDMMMMEVSLEDDTGDQQRQQQQHALSSSNSSNNKVLGLPPTQPMQPQTSSTISLQHSQNQLLRHPSPLVMHRSSSGGGASASNHTNISTSYSDPQSLGMGPHSLRSRSRSRSRSIGNNNRRLRSLGAAVIFANAAAAASSSSLGSSNHSNPQQQQQQLDNNLEGGHEMSSSAVYYEFDPITIPLVDILGVDEEVPSSSSSRKRSGSSGGSGCGNNNNNSEFYSSAASDIGVAKEVASAATGSATTTDQHQSLPPLLTSPPPSTSHGGSSGGRPSHRIFLHTLSSGYLEFSLDNANSHDSFMAYLKAHLPSDRIPCRSSSNKNNTIGSSSYISSSAPTKVMNNVGMLRTMVLTPTKEVPSSLTTTATTGNVHAASHSKQQQLDTHQSSPPPTPTIVPSSSTSVCSNRIDKLHSKMMHQRLQYEKQSRPPLTRIKERMVNWMSSVIDCGCCFDTTVAPLETASSSVSGTGTGSAPYKETTPNTKALKKKGIGGLSFEVETPPMPSLSFERF